MKGLTFLNYNIENLSDKLSDALFIDYVSHFDVICLTETFMGDSFDFSTVFLEHKDFCAPGLKLSSHGRRSGGVLVLIRKCLVKYVKKVVLGYDNTVAIRFDKSVFGVDKDIVMIGCYVVPEGGPAYKHTDLDDGILILEEHILQSFNKDSVYFIICGDLNARTGAEQPKEEDMFTYVHGHDYYYNIDGEGDDGCDDIVKRLSKDITVNNFGHSMLDLCFLLDLWIMNGSCNSDVEGEFTFMGPNGNSVVDYFLVSRGIAVNCDLTVKDSLYSWHFPVVLTWKKCFVPRSVLFVPQPGEDQVVWSDEHAHIYREEQSADEFRHCLDAAMNTLCTDINRSVELFVNALHGAAACMVRKVGRKKRVINDWFDAECQRKKRLVKRLLQSYRRAKTDKDKRDKRIGYVEERKEYVKLRKEKKAEFDKKRLQKLKESVEDPKLFWATIRSINRKTMVYNEITSRQWYDHFFSVFNTCNIEQESTLTRDFENEELPSEPLFDDPITTDEVKASIAYLKNGKSAGPDRIISEMLKHGGTPVIEFLVSLFNILFDSGSFPAIWCKSIIVPIFKKGDSNNPNNYRGVALTSIISKVYTHILNKRLTQWAQKEEKHIEEQAGFRSGYSTIDHIFTLYALVQRFLKRNTKLYVAFVDFKKAFDSVNRNILWHVLRKNGVNGKLYMALRGVYDSVIACVRDKSVYSDYFNCPRGVKQGCILSPQMFAFFINELSLEMSRWGKHGVQLSPGALELFMLLFADDVILISSTPIGLQNQLNILKSEADKLQLTVNLDKTGIIVFRNGGHLSKWERWMFGNVEVEVTNLYKYLGMTFTTRLSLNIGWQETCRKGKRGVMEILRCLKKLRSIDPSLFWKLFDAQIEPMLTYAAEVWGLEENVHMKKVHTFAIKRFMNVPIHSSNTMIYGESGRYPLYIRTFVKCIKYWLKLIRLPRSRICRQAYDMLLHQFEMGNQNWASSVKNILATNGFAIVWLCQEVGDVDLFICEFKDRLVSNYKQNWHSKMEEYGKYSWFYSFKSIFQSEHFLRSVTHKWHRDMFARFRTRTLGFKANKRWFEQTNTTDDICILCEEGVKEDERHFLFDCSAYNNIRCKSQLFHTFFAKRKNLTSMLATDDDVILKNLAKYIAEAVSYRNKKIVIKD